MFFLFINYLNKYHIKTHFIKTCLFFINKCDEKTVEIEEVKTENKKIIYNRWNINGSLVSNNSVKRNTNKSNIIKYELLGEL